MPLRIDEIMERPEPAAPDETLHDALRRFLSDQTLRAIVVAFDGAPLGLLSRAWTIEAALGGEAALKSPLTRHMSSTPCLIESGTVIGAAAKAAVANGASALQDGAVIVSDGAYVGFAPPDAILTALASENEARARALQTAQQRIGAVRREAADAAVETAQFVAMLGHEIRTPLTGVLGVADLLCDSGLEDEPRKMARTISRSGRLLDRLLTDMLDLSRMEAGKLALSPEPFLLRDFARETRDLWIGRTDGRDVSLKVDVSAGSVERLEGDAVRLRQILYNLVSNALKFTERGGVRVILSTSESENGGLSLSMSVADTGPGVSAEDKVRLFERFEQATIETARRHGGHGLGLAVAKGIVDQMGGVITLEDNPGGGAIFKVQTPIRRAGPRLAVQNAPRPRRANFQLGDILVVEDHAVTRFVVERALSAAGWTIDTAQNEREAVEKARKTRYQAILMDMHLAEGDGASAARAILGGVGLNVRTPLIAMTADISPERRTAAAQAGFAAFVEKPIRPRDLVASIADAVLSAEAPPQAVGARA